MAEQEDNNNEFEDEFGDFEQADESEEKKESEFFPQENSNLPTVIQQNETPLESISKNENYEGEEEKKDEMCLEQTKEMRELNPGKTFEI